MYKKTNILGKNTEKATIYKKIFSVKKKADIHNKYFNMFSKHLSMFSE